MINAGVFLIENHTDSKKISDTFGSLILSQQNKCKTFCGGIYSAV
jgi:hypothetical protein